MGCKDVCCRQSDTSWRRYYGSDCEMNRADTDGSVSASTTVFLGDKEDEESGARGSRSSPSCSHATEHAARRFKDMRDVRAAQHAANMQVRYSAQPIAALLGLAHSAAE